MHPNRKSSVMKVKREGKADGLGETRSRSKSPKLAPTATSGYRSRSPLSPPLVHPTDSNLEVVTHNQITSHGGSHTRYLTPKSSQIEQALKEIESDGESEASVIFVSSRPAQKKKVNTETSKNAHDTSENPSSTKQEGVQDFVHRDVSPLAITATRGTEDGVENPTDAVVAQTVSDDPASTLCATNPRDNIFSDSGDERAQHPAKPERQAICYKKIPVSVKEWHVKEMLVEKGILSFIEVGIPKPARKGTLYGVVQIYFANITDAESAKQILSKKKDMWCPNGEKGCKPQTDKTPVPKQMYCRFEDAKIKTRLLKVVIPYQGNMAMVEERLLKEGGVAQGPWKSDYPEFRCVFKFDDADAARLARILLTPWPAPKVVEMFGDDFRGIELHYKGTPLEIDSDAEDDAPAGLQPVRLGRRPTKNKATTDRGPKRPVYPWKREDEVHDHWADRG